jgi:FtsZ-interacting cell division protein ZipA
MVVLRRRLQEKSTRLRVMIGAAALLVALVFLIPLSSSSANSSASASNNATDKAAQNAPDKTAHNATDKTAQNGTDKAAQNAPNKAAQNAPASEARDQETTPKLPAAARQQVTTPPVADPQRELNEAAPTQAAAPAPASANTEEMAAAMLLSGRREEALQMYQALAKSTAASPGIEAMVLVLSQKVAAQ